MFGFATNLRNLQVKSAFITCFCLPEAQKADNLLGDTGAPEVSRGAGYAVEAHWRRRRGPRLTHWSGTVGRQLHSRQPFARRQGPMGAVCAAATRRPQAGRAGGEGGT